MQPKITWKAFEDMDSENRERACCGPSGWLEVDPKGDRFQLLCASCNKQQQQRVIDDAANPV